MAWIGAVIGLAGTVMQGQNDRQHGQAINAAAQFNATVAEQNADAAREETRLQVRAQDRETYMRLGAIKAGAAKNGGTMGGSALDVLADTAFESEFQRQTTMYAGELKARGFQNTAMLDRMQGAAGIGFGNTQATSDLLQGGAKSYALYSSLNGGSKAGNTLKVAGNAGDGLDT